MGLYLGLELQPTTTLPPPMLPLLLQVMQEGLAAAVGLSNDDGSASGPAASMDEQQQQDGLPPLPGWQRRRAERRCRGLFPDHQRLEERLQEAAAAAVVLRNVAEVQQNAALLLDPPVMRCWTWALDAARELVQQQVGSSSGGSGGLVVAGGGTAADICTTLLQMTTVLSGRMLLPAFFECGMLLLRSLLILLRPSWQYSAAAAGGAVLPPPLVSLATLAVTAVATAYQPNTDILLSMTGAPGGGQPGATLMQVIADLLVCPFEVFRWVHTSILAPGVSMGRELPACDVGLLALERGLPPALLTAQGLLSACPCVAHGMQVPAHAACRGIRVVRSATTCDLRQPLPPAPAGSMRSSKWTRSLPAGDCCCPRTQSSCLRRSAPAGQAAE